ncbi:MAG: class I SAM-dependent methyltransferase [Bryobacterales bacterium]|nr:class I SAM-dependent methyltransferase [Bryobacteraceae bacterium]MDW8131739.1 class I SAM-dependent methyltransferase [Bryobacterales bacterium]
MSAEAPDARAEELAAIVREIRERVRSRYPAGGEAGEVRIPLTDLMPVLHARDAAEGKVAAIGTVNPRPPGMINDAIQLGKRILARLLNWHVREQVEFNRAVVASLDAILEALNANNRTFARIAAALDAIEREFRERAGALETELRRRAEQLEADARELRDILAHWAAWRQDWEHKLASNESQFLRAVADLQAGFQHRVDLMEANFRDLVHIQRRDISAELERGAIEIQKRLWADLEKVRVEFERLIHQELRLIRQRNAARAEESAATPARPAPVGAAEFADWLKFAERFRGSEEYVKAQQRFYVPFFEGRQAVVDLGCGRGEFLELLREAGVPARGVDFNAEAVAICRSKGLEAEHGDLFEWLAAQPDSAFDGIFCAQVVEHLPPLRVSELVRRAASKLVPGGVLVVETPNPECLAIFATHYYLDPSHRNPIPPALLVFYFEEAGFGDIRVERRSPALQAAPCLQSLPSEFREAFFGAMDYAVIGRRLG